MSVFITLFDRASLIVQYGSDRNSHIDTHVFCHLTTPWTVNWTCVIVVEHDLWAKRLNNSVVVVMYIFKWRVSCVTLTYESLLRNELPLAVIIITHSMCAAWFRYNTCLYKIVYEATPCKIYNKAPVLRIAGYLHLRCVHCIQLTFDCILINHCRYIGCSIVLCIPE